MSFSIPKRIIQLLTVLCAAVVLLISVFLGVSNGKSRAQSTFVLDSAFQLSQGLKYFHQDQDRFPSAMEFQDNRNLMLNYFTYFPPAQFALGKCPSSFSYQRPSLQAFRLQFCLPVEWNGVKAGWNEFNQDVKFN